MKRDTREKTQTYPPRMAYAKWTALTCSHEQFTRQNGRYIERIKAHCNEPRDGGVSSEEERNDNTDNTKVPLMLRSPR
jgi:hypothetical protein